MSPECEAFIQAVIGASDFSTGQLVGPPDWDAAFVRLNGLNMDEMLRALAALDPLDRAALWAQQAASAGSVNMPRIEYAYNVVKDRRLPATAPGDLDATGQVATARGFLAKATPLTFDRDLTGMLPDATANPPRLTEPDYVAAAARIGAEVAAVQAVAQVEAGGRIGFGGDGRPIIRYELHIFHGRTGGTYDRTHPHLSQPTLAAGNRFHTGGQANEWSLMYGAMILRDASGKRRASDAWRSASWGMFQVMGFNFAVDWADIATFVNDMFVSEAQHLRAFLGYVRTNHLGNTLVNHDWAGFARGYNGPDYATNNYDTNIGNAFNTIQGNRRRLRLPP
jgi:N-acetylmuramidase-like protein